MSSRGQQGRYVCLLRGINVGGHNKLRMKELEEAFRNLGFDNVSSYIRSGNLVFTAPGDETTESLELKIESEIRDRFGYEVPAITISSRDFDRAVKNLPFSAEEEEKSVLVFLSGDASSEWAERARPKIAQDERFDLQENVAYLYTPNGLSKSKAAESLLSRPRVGVKATMRNWRTVNKILEMLADIPAVAE